MEYLDNMILVAENTISIIKDSQRQCYNDRSQKKLQNRITRLEKENSDILAQYDIKRPLDRQALLDNLTDMVISGENCGHLLDNAVNAVNALSAYCKAIANAKAKIEALDLCPETNEKNENNDGFILEEIEEFRAHDDENVNEFKPNGPSL